jgi:galactitol-specific phosphotransferase system IIB component
LGYSAFSAGESYTNSTGIGYNAQPGASNTVRIGDGFVTSIGGYAAWTNLSDGRFKTNVKENVAGIDFIMKLRPVTYNLDMNAIAKFNNTPDSLRLPESEKLKGTEIQIGFIAQEVEQAAQSLGFDFHGVDKPKNETSHYGLRYAEFVVPMVKAMQEQQVVIVQLKQENEELKQQIKEILKRLEEMGK